MKEPKLDIVEFTELYPDNVHPNLLDDIQSGRKIHNIASSARFGEYVYLGRGVRIYDNVHVGKHSQIGDFSVISHGTIVNDEVVIGERVEIADGCLFLPGAMICPNPVISASSNARQILSGVSIGEKVKIHDEVEIGEDAVIPNQRTISHIGFFGLKNRVVTIYGSDDGPRYSIGCQVGVDYDSIRSNIQSSLYTEPESSITYVPYLGVFQEIGTAVQTAYEASRSQIEEIRSIRRDIGLDFDESED